MFKALIERNIIPEKTEKSEKYPDEKYFIMGDQISTKIILGYLSYKGILYKKDSLINSYGYLINAAGNFGAHNQPDDPHSYQPTKYTNQGHIYAMMDLLLWFKDVMDKNNRWIAQSNQKTKFICENLDLQTQNCKKGI